MKTFVRFLPRDIRAELSELATRPLAHNNPNRARIERLFRLDEDESEQREPSAVRAEIEQLGQMNRVSNVLGTAGPRIESTLRNILERRIRPPTSTAVVAAPPEPSPSRQTNDGLTTATAAAPATASIADITREQIVTDISELVHRQLVSSTLRSDFRTALEQRILSRMRG